MTGIGYAPSARHADARVPQRTLSAADLALGLRVLGDALETGLPMHRALAVFSELAPPAWGTAIPGIRESVRQGHSLATALEESTIAFPSLVVGMVRAGESGSGVGAAVRRAALHAERTAATRDAVRSALAYPMVVAAAGIGSLVVMVGVVIPRFATILADIGQVLPPSTRFVLGVASVSRAAALPASVSVGAVVVVLAAWRRTTEGRLAQDAFTLRIPIVGRTRWSAATARVATALAALLDSGVAIRAALRAAARAAGDSEIERRIAAAQELIAGGATLARALGETAAITPTAARLVRAGEETGRLVPLLEHAALIEERRAERTIARGVRFLEPALILAFAGVVGIVAMALLQAVYAVRPV